MTVPVLAFARLVDMDEQHNNKEVHREQEE